MLSSRVSGSFCSWAHAAPWEVIINTMNPITHLILIGLLPPFRSLSSLQKDLQGDIPFGDQ
jgi:hypothetical protein